MLCSHWILGARGGEIHPPSPVSRRHKVHGYNRQIEKGNTLIDKEDGRGWQEEGSHRVGQKITQSQCVDMIKTYKDAQKHGRTATAYGVTFDRSYAKEFRDRQLRWRKLQETMQYPIFLKKYYYMYCECIITYAQFKNKVKAVGITQDAHLNPIFAFVQTSRQHATKHKAFFRESHADICPYSN